MKHHVNSDEQVRSLIKNFWQIQEQIYALQERTQETITAFFADYDDDALFAELELQESEESVPLSTQRIQQCFGIGYVRAAALRERWEELHGIPGRQDDPEKFEDDKYDVARALVVENRIASPALLQRKLGIGYARAASLMDELEAHGVIGPRDGAKPREVLIAPESDRVSN